jgi:hypothetical protein
LVVATDALHFGDVHPSASLFHVVVQHTPEPSVMLPYQPAHGRYGHLLFAYNARTSLLELFVDRWSGGSGPRGPDRGGEDSLEKRLGKPQPFNRVEAAYARMAKAGGLDVVEMEVLESDQGHAHLVIPRFGSSGGMPLHQHTLGGLLHVDYHDPGASSYEEYLRTMLKLGLPPAALLEGYRRMVFIPHVPIRQWVLSVPK